MKKIKIKKKELERIKETWTSTYDQELLSELNAGAIGRPSGLAIRKAFKLEKEGLLKNVHITNDFLFGELTNKGKRIFRS
jgi:hypothetical protein